MQIVMLRFGRSRNSSKVLKQQEGKATSPVLQTYSSAIAVQMRKIIRNSGKVVDLNISFSIHTSVRCLWAPPAYICCCIHSYVSG